MALDTALLDDGGDGGNEIGDGERGGGGGGGSRGGGGGGGRGSGGGGGDGGSVDGGGRSTENHKETQMMIRKPSGTSAECKSLWKQQAWPVGISFPKHVSISSYLN